MDEEEGTVAAEEKTPEAEVKVPEAEEKVPETRERPQETEEKVREPEVEEVVPENQGGGDEKKTEKKKSNWKTIGHDPVNYELFPCPHRWQQKHPRGACKQYKQIRWILLPLSDRTKQLALPTLRRLLALWLEFGDKFPPEIRERLLQFLINNYGLTKEFLEEILVEARKAREEALKKKKEKTVSTTTKGKKEEEEKEEEEKKGKKGKKKKKKGKKKKKKGKKKKKKGKKKKKKGKKKKKKGKKKKKKGKKKKKKGKKSKKKGKTKKKGKGYGLLFKKRKAGKLPLDWPYKMGSKFLLKCIAYLSKDPDEDYNSRATEYFDVQAMAILEQVCRYMDMPLPDPEKPTQYGETLVIMALNLADWIAKYVTTPAQEIPDNKVEEYLNLRGKKPKKPKPKKQKKPKKKKKPKKRKKGKKGKKGKKKGKKKEKKKEKSVEPEPVTEVQRNWNEMKSPVYVPEKSRISKRKNLEEAEEDEKELEVIDMSYATDTEMMEEHEGVPRWKQPTLDEIKKEFLEYINWYNPWEPEFMYLGPRKTPKGVHMFKIWDPDSDDIPADLRALNWNQIEYGFTDNYSFIPSSVPQYYPALRPLRPIRLEEVEKSGISKTYIKRNLRFFSPWYLMSKPLKPPVSFEETEMTEENEGEFLEEILEDEILIPEKEPPIRDSLWGDCKMKEQLEIIGHILCLMASIPDLTLEYVFELLEEFCEAVECAERDENSTPENKLLLKKRIIILERYFLSFFGKKFRDFNAHTPRYMRVLCSRCAYFIQMLYEHTSRILWELQSQDNPPTPVPSRPVTPDDPDALRDWDEWLAWLLKVTETCDDWAGWITETVNEAERKATKKENEFIGPDGKKVLLTTDEWFDWKSEVEQKLSKYKFSKKQIFKESTYYLEKAKNILPVKHRQKICKGAEEIFGEEEEEYGEMEEEEEEESEKEKAREYEEESSWKIIKEREPVYETDDTEWEDVEEFEELA